MSAATDVFVPDSGGIGDPLVELRWAAALGYLPNIANDRRIAAAAYALAARLTFERHTRPLELRRGHYACARSFTQMPDGCRDHFHDDVLAVRDHLLRRSTKPIANVEGWLVRSMTTATIEGYRKRRGEVGASHKGNVPARLAAVLDDPWLVELAHLMLIWVGIPATAGLSVWPTESWAQRRSQHTGDPRDNVPAAVTREIEHVTAAMKDYNPTWFERYIEKPLGSKVLPVADEPADAAEQAAPADGEETMLREAAAMVVEYVAAELAAGADLEVTVRRALGAFRERCLTQADDTGALPHAYGIGAAVNRGLTPERIEQLVPIVLAIIVAATEDAVRQFPDDDDCGGTHDRRGEVHP